MPHLVLEYSSNVAFPPDPGRLFDRLHRGLHETGGISIGNCKSRARAADPFYVASGEGAGAFVHLDVRFLEGRSNEVLDAVGRGALETLEHWFREAGENLDLQLTVEIREIERSAYFKFPEGTLGYQQA
jgi:5-carboxymethyl-2-hydroxymuconate isomerase